MLVEDFKDEAGLWVTSFRSNGVRYFTKSYKTYCNMVQRCKYQGKFQIRYPSYLGCKNLFKDFQEYAEWATTQTGYPEGVLDKDILGGNEKVYSKDTCCFVPQEINNLVLTNKGRRGEYPIGVSFHKKSGKFRSSFSSGNKYVHLGHFDNADEAFAAYKVHKKVEIKRLAEFYKQQISLEVYKTLMEHEVHIDC